MKHCTHCGGENRDQAQFCGHCGRSFTTDTLEQLEPRIGKSTSSRVKILVSFASGIVVGCLLTVAFLAQEPAEVEVLTTTHLAGDKVDPKMEGTAREVPATEHSIPAKVDSKTEEAARRKLEEMGIPYIAEAFIGEAEGGNTEAVELFLVAGMDPNTELPIRGSALMAAAEKGHTKTAQVLLTKGADANAADPLGQTALMKAAKNGHIDVIKALLDNGAYVNTKDYFGGTALKDAKYRPQ